MDALRLNNESLDLDLDYKSSLFLHQLSCNRSSYTIEQFIAALEASVTLMILIVDFDKYYSTPENNRRFIEPLCRCIANLRHHNENHPLRTVKIYKSKKDDFDAVDEILVAAKQFRSPRIHFSRSRVRIQSLAEFCRDNTHLQKMTLNCAKLSDDAFALSQPQESSTILALDKLVMESARFENSTVATKFANIISNATYPTLQLGKISVGFDDDDNNDDKEEKKIARLFIVSELFKPSVEDLILTYFCQIESIDAIEACVSVTYIELCRKFPPIDFSPAAVQRMLQTIATRNRELARFVANPHASYPRDDLLTLMRQLDGCPTGRYMLAHSFASMPSFFKPSRVRVPPCLRNSIGPAIKERGFDWAVQ